jgi:hypothetical protein
VASWLERHGQTARLRELLWEPLALGALNQPIETAAAAAFVRVLGGVFGPDPRDAAIGVPVAPLSEVFAAPARRYLERHGSTVRTHAPARLVIREGRTEGVDVRGERIGAGAVVSAVPWTAWRTLISEADAASAGLAELRRAALARRPSPIVTVNVWLNRPVLPAAFLGMPGRVFQWVFQHEVRGGARTTAGAHLSFVSSGADAIAATRSDALIATAWQELCDGVPQAASGHVVGASVVRERHATFSLAPGEPARPGTATPVAGLWLAGDWTDTGLPATLEGAVASGHAAARAILQGLPAERS